jgi:hypothetical protein
MWIKWVKGVITIFLSYLILSFPTSQGTLFDMLQKYSGGIVQEGYEHVYQLGHEQWIFLKEQTKKFFLEVSPLDKKKMNTKSTIMPTTKSDSDADTDTADDSSYEFMESHYRSYQEFNEKKMNDEEKKRTSVESALIK